MKDWTALLEEVIPIPCHDRPFVCDGLPEKSKVMVIGENPGMPLNQEWWDYWNPKTGFSYGDFLADYRKKKDKDNEKKGKTKLPESFRGARNRFYHIHKRGAFCIETNIYRNEKQRGAGEDKIENISVLSALIANNKNLKLIIVHGDEARKGLGIILAKNENQEVLGELREKAQEVLGKLPERVALYTTRHFRKEGNEEVYQILCNYNII